MAKNISKVISGGDELGTYRRWVLPEVSSIKGPSRNSPPAAMIATSSQMDKIRKQAYDEGFQSGLKDGVVAGKEEYRKKLQHIEKIIQTLNTPLADLDGQVIDELVRLAMTIARHMIRREIKADPGEVVGVVREALGSLPVASR